MVAWERVNAPANRKCQDNDIRILLTNYLSPPPTPILPTNASYQRLPQTPILRTLVPAGSTQLVHLFDVIHGWWIGTRHYLQHCGTCSLEQRAGGRIVQYISVHQRQPISPRARRITSCMRCPRQDGSIDVLHGLLEVIRQS